MTKWLVAAAFTVVVSAGAFGNGKAQDSPARNKELCARFIEEVVNQGRLETLDELLDPDLVDHAPSPPGFSGSGVERVRRRLQELRSAFPDLTAVPGDMIAEGDRVVLRGAWSGTWTGAFLGRPPSGRRVSFEVIDILRISGGRCVEHWGRVDLNALLGSSDPAPK